MTADSQYYRTQFNRFRASAKNEGYSFQYCLLRLIPVCGSRVTKFHIGGVSAQASGEQRSGIIMLGAHGFTARNISPTIKH